MLSWFSLRQLLYPAALRVSGLRVVVRGLLLQALAVLNEVTPRVVRRISDDSDTVHGQFSFDDVHKRVRRVVLLHEPRVLYWQQPVAH